MGEIEGRLVFGSSHRFMKFCLIDEIEGRVVFSFWSSHRFMKFCWLKDVRWNRGKGGFWGLEVFMVL